MAQRKAEFMNTERGLSHSFYRSFEFKGKTFDRLELIKKHGLVFPKKAKEENIPHMRREKPIMKGLDQEIYDRVIFLYDENLRWKGMPIPGDVLIHVDGDVEVIEPEEMMENYPGWVSFSIGEVYVLDQINSDKITYE